ncbi:MAG: RsmE family RNA methyltransferase, partial [Ignavibacteria bacterium]
MYLSDIELYYSGPQEPVNEFIILSGEERDHLVKVMRHSQGEEIFITNGLGKIFKAVTEKIFKDSIEAKVIEIYSYINKKKNYTFCIRRLKNPERFEFALEKCAELGITDFLVFNSSRTISKGSR